MKVLVSDTSVLIDLDRGVLVEAAFRLPFAFTVPDVLYERELRKHSGPDLVELGLRVEELDGDGVTLALGYLRKRRSRSLPDSFALALAKKNAWTLLSGDRGLRELAKEEEVQCHGALWAARPDVRAPRRQPKRLVRRTRQDCCASAVPATDVGDPQTAPLLCRLLTPHEYLALVTYRMVELAIERERGYESGSPAR